jgi:thiol:disulfide interchange protein DsbD
VDLTIGEGWSYYSPQPGSSGDFAPLPAAIEVTAPGLRVVNVLWPAAELHNYELLGQKLSNNVYMGRTIAFVMFEAPADAPHGEYAITVAPTGQACGYDECVAVRGDKSATVRVTVAGTDAPSPAWNDDPAYATGLTSAAPPTTMPHVPGGSQWAELTVLGGLGLALLAGLALNIMPCVLPVIPLKVLAIVESARKSRRQFVTVGLAFAGGIILFFAGVAAVNAALRIVTRPAFTVQVVDVGTGQYQSHAFDAQGREMGRASHGIDWGEHFQSTPFRVALTLVVTVLAANLFGLFHVALTRRMVLGGAAALAVALLAALGCCALGMAAWWLRVAAVVLGAAVLAAMLWVLVRATRSQAPADWGPHASAVGAGLLTGLLSTPCSFAALGAALAWGQIQPLWLGTVTIMLIGVGMASPYIMLIAFPQLVAAVPRPGRWTELFRQSMGFLLLLVAVWLLSTNSSDAYPFCVAGYLVVLAFCLWVWGTWVGPHTPLGRKVAARVLALALGVWAGLYMLKPAAPAGVELLPFDQTALEAAVAEGKTVVVDFTASWCLTCKYVEATVYDSEHLAAELRKRGVIAMKGDVTQALVPADKLRIALGESVPVTVVFKPNAQPVRLRGIFTIEDLLKALD